MTVQGRVIILMMDSFGIGAADDAAAFDNLGADTFGHIAEANGGLNIPNLSALGLNNAYEAANGKVAPVGRQKNPQITLPSKYGYMKEISLDKDTTSGHWELAGLPVLNRWGHFKPDYPSFPPELIEKILKDAGYQYILGNLAASGTEIIQVHGEEHIRCGQPIFYTSADSNIQIAAHEKYFGLDNLYRLCEIAYKHAKPYNIARIIARPFIGEKAGEFIRTPNRHDYSVKPFGETLLSRQKKTGRPVIAIGKISDIYAGEGVTSSLKASGLNELWQMTLGAVRDAPAGSLIFTNFVDFDMTWGHRRDAIGYAGGLEYFDRRLPEIVPYLHDSDIVFITADHGNDPTYKGTDHTREFVPVIIFGHQVQNEFIGRRETFADLGQTAADFLELEPLTYGKSFL